MLRNDIYDLICDHSLEDFLRVVIDNLTEQLDIADKTDRDNAKNIIDKFQSDVHSLVNEFD